MKNCEKCVHKLSKFPFCSNNEVQPMIIGLRIKNRATWTQITDSWETDGTICGGYEYG